MNRILFDRCELEDGYVSLTDFRAEHIRKVLKSKPGDVLKTGELDGSLSAAEVIKISAKEVVLRIDEHSGPKRPAVDLIVALPRPKVLNRLLPQISALGVDRLVLCNASKVERYYFDTHVLEEKHLRAQLIEGLMQCGDTCLPKVTVVRQLRHFLEDKLESFSEGADKWILHPGGAKRIVEMPRKQKRVVLVIGPEGGWLESEVEGFVERGFESVTLMNRILRADTATVAALSAVAMRNREVIYGS
jgi:RsmE family RNA methyltransferase